MAKILSKDNNQAWLSKLVVSVAFDETPHFKPLEPKARYICFGSN